MAGTVRGSIEHLITAAGGLPQHRDSSIALIKFLESHPSWTSIASQGNGATGAPSTWTYTGGANDPGDNAWVVFRNTGGVNSWHLFIQFSWNAGFGTAPGSPGDSPWGFGSAVQMAFDTSGGTSIWNGGTANLGVDAKASPVWVADGGTLIVFPRGNGAGGSFNVNKEACASLTQADGVPARLQFVADDDFVWYGSDLNNNGDYEVCCYMGPWTPDDNVTPVGAPLCMLQQAGSFSVFSAVGTLLNSSLAGEGGIVAAIGQDQARIFSVSQDNSWLATTFQPNTQRSPAGHDLLDIPLVVNDAQGTASYGYLGKIELVQMAFNVPTHDTNGPATKAFFGDTAAATLKWVVPWDGATVPGSGGTRNGIQF